MKLRISSKMLAGFLGMAVLLLAGGLLTILYTYRLHRVTAELLADNIASLKAAQELQSALFRMRDLTFSYVLDGDPRWLKDLQAEKANFRSWLEEAKEATRSPHRQTMLRTLSGRFADYEAALERALASSQSGKGPKEIQARLLQETRGGFVKIFDLCAAFESANENAIYDAEEKLDHTSKVVRATMLGLALGGIVLGAILGVVISRSIVNPIYELVLKVRGAAGRELVERVDVERGTELEELDHHVHGLIDRINTARADLERNRRLLARAERLAALGKMAAGVAHEVRNPLTAIKMLIYSMREDLAIDDEKRRDLEVVIKEIDRLERFVQNFLEFARPPDPVFAPIDVNETIGETLALLEPRLRQNVTEVVEACQPDLEPILADGDQIKQVVMNLVLNAIEAMPHGGRLTVETLQIDSPEGTNGQRWVQIRIKDTGRGIPEELMDNLFDPFVSGREDGIGLGLSIAHQIVHLHGGWIEATTNPEGGATFTVTLPADRG